MFGREHYLKLPAIELNDWFQVFPDEEIERANTEHEKRPIRPIRPIRVPRIINVSGIEIPINCDANYSNYYKTHALTPHDPEVGYVIDGEADKQLDTRYAKFLAEYYKPKPSLLGTRTITNDDAVTIDATQYPNAQQSISFGSYHVEMESFGLLTNSPSGRSIAPHFRMLMERLRLHLDIPVPELLIVRPENGIAHRPDEVAFKMFVNRLILESAHEYGVYDRLHFSDFYPRDFGPLASGKVGYVDFHPGLHVYTSSDDAILRDIKGRFFLVDEGDIPHDPDSPKTNYGSQKPTFFQSLRKRS